MSDPSGIVGPNPYVGPRSFDLREAFFYGRDRETRELASLLTARRVVVLHSPAGAGKTSLIQAALIPALEQRNFTVLPVIRVGRPLSSGADRPTMNRYTLSSILSLQESRATKTTTRTADPLKVEETEAPEVIADLSLAQYLDRRAQKGNNKQPEVIIFDQFEELLTLDPDDTRAKRDFFTQLEELLDSDRPGEPGHLSTPRWVLFSMREEYLGAMAAYLRGLPTGGNALYRLDLLRGSGALEAIRKPADARGVKFAVGAGERLVENLSRARADRIADQPPTDRPLGVPVISTAPTIGRDESPTTAEPSAAMDLQSLYVEPVQLQVVCYRLWEHLAEAKKTLVDADDIDKLADVIGALAGYYRERVKKAADVSGIPEWDIRRWFETALITRGGIRAVVQFGADGDRGLPDSAVRQLENAYLVRREERRGIAWLELSHDRLIDPVLRDNKLWFEDRLQPFQIQADRWRQRPAGKKDMLLLRSEALLEAERWVKSHPGQVRHPEDEEFLKACQEARTTRNRLFYRWWAFLGTGAILIMLVLLRWAVLEKQDAEAAEKREKAAQVEAETRRQDAEQAAATAQTAKENAETAQKKADKSNADLQNFLKEQTDSYFTLLNQVADDASLLATSDDPSTVLKAGYAWQLLYGFICPEDVNAPQTLKTLTNYHALAALLKELSADVKANRNSKLPTRTNLAYSLANELGNSLRKNPSTANQHIWIELRKRYFQEATDVTAQLADPKLPADKREIQIAAFWKLYWVKLALVEGTEVKNAMVNFGNALHSSEIAVKAKEPSKVPPDLNKKSLQELATDIANACSEEKKVGQLR